MLVKYITRLPIRLKILSGSVLALIMISIFIFTYFPYKSSRQINLALQDKYHSMAEMISLGVGVGMESGDFEIIMEALKWARKDSSVVFIEVLDENLQEFALYNPSNTVFEIPFLLENNDIIELDKKSIHLAKTPIIYQNKNYGELILGTSLAYYTNLIRKNTNSLLFVTLIIFIVVFIFSYWFSKTITKPLIKLHQSVNEIASGNYEIDFNVTAEDEIGALAKSFMSMAKRIKLFISQEAMRVSEERYSSMVETAHDIIWTLDVDGNFTYINNRLENVTGHKVSDWIGKQFSAFINSEDNLDNEDLFKIAIQEGSHYQEVKVISTLGKLIILAVSSSTLYENNKFSGLVSFGRDITRQKKAEEELIENLDFNRSLLATLPTGMDVVDEEGIILFLNPAMEKLIGPGNLNKKCWEVYRDDKTRCYNCPLKKPFETGITDVLECDGILGGRIFEIFHSGMMFRGKKAFMEIFLDITERKNAELKLKSALAKAQESDRLKSTFLNTMSHELRTPLNAIIGLSECIDKDMPLDDIIDSVKIINNSGQNLLEIIKDIFDIVLIESGEVKIKNEWKDLNLIMSNLLVMLEKLQQETDKQDIKIVFEQKHDDKEFLFFTDYRILQMILIQLLRNALKFTEVGSIEFGYKDEIDNNNHFLNIYVKDSGIGISNEKMIIIFDLFRQGDDASTRKYGGIGLGLTISKKLTEVLGGKISVESVEGKSTTFHIMLPYNKIPSTQLNFQNQETDS